MPAGESEAVPQLRVRLGLNREARADLDSAALGAPNFKLHPQSGR